MLFIIEKHHICQYVLIVFNTKYNRLLYNVYSDFCSHCCLINIACFLSDWVNNVRKGDVDVGMSPNLTLISHTLSTVVVLPMYLIDCLLVSSQSW